jgi:hypothetical protein
MMSRERTDYRSLWIMFYGFRFPRNLSNRQTGGKLSPMARELVWLENRAFVAWGGACDWIIPNPPGKTPYARAGLPLYHRPGICQKPIRVSGLEPRVLTFVPERMDSVSEE